MELDHFRPKDFPEYRYLINDPNNLVWSCRGCNRLKLSKWPALGEVSSIKGEEGFIDPFLDDRLEFFHINAEGIITPLKAPAKYVITTLSLNRHSRIRYRMLRILRHIFLGEVERHISNIERTIKSSLPEDSTDDLSNAKALLESMRDHLLLPSIDFTLH